MASMLLLTTILSIAEETRLVIPRIQAPIIFDGLSNEAAWNEAAHFSYVMQMPNFGEKPTERTELLLAYDDEYLYIAGRLFDREPGKIQCPTKKRDAMIASTDWFGVLIDTFNDKENALGFFTTPSGLRFDVTVFDDAQGEMPINTDWNTFWDVATARNQEGWFVEMRIPVSSLRFQDKDGSVVMGLISWRWIPRKNEMNIFPSIPQNWGQWSAWKPSQAREIEFQGLFSRKPLYITPYILGGHGQSYELDEGETAYVRKDDPVLEVGLDIKYGLTSNLTLDLSVNTDFAQVEADDQQVNLTRFSLFFPEKRLFFQERGSNFNFNLGGPNSLFYSRRIGLYEDKPVRIYGGARLVGRVGGWDLGFLNMQTAPIEDQPSENFGVMRLRRRIFNPHSYIGGIITTRIGSDNTYNVAYGVDGIIRLFRDDYLQFHWAQTFETEEKNNPLSLAPSRFSFNWERRTTKGLGYHLNLSRSGSAFNPGIGFLMREDYTRIGNKWLYGWVPGKDSSLFSHDIFLDGSVHLRNEDMGIESLEIGPGWEFSTKSGWSAKIWPKLYYEDVPEAFSFTNDDDDDDEDAPEAEVPIGKYTFVGVTGQYMSPMGRFLSALITFDAGTFYDGWRVTLGVMPQWNILSDLELSGFFQYNQVKFPDRNQGFAAHIARLRLLATLSTKFSSSAFIQYNGAAEAIIGNIRIRYNPKEGTDIYLVYNQGLNTNRNREIPTLPFVSDRTLLLKINYTFNF